MHKSPKTHTSASKYLVYFFKIGCAASLWQEIAVLFTRAILILLASSMKAGVSEVTLHVRDTVVNYSGTETRAIAVNGGIPMPTLYFTEGDTAVIRVVNHMHHETSMHWHGLLLPNEQDGVPYLTTAPIKPLSEHVFKFAIRQSGTYWYHSHTMLQEQVGMYGAIVIRKRNAVADNEEVMLLSDWTDEDPHEIERRLHYASDWYMIQKDAVQSYGEALFSGNFDVKIENEFKRMHAMDVSDVYYVQFHVNGKQRDTGSMYKKGDKVRLRIINGSASTYFWVTFSGGPFNVVASDGVEVVPVRVSRLIIGVSEIYDIEVTIPENGLFEVRSTSEDRIGYSSFFLGSGELKGAESLGRLNYFAGMNMMNEMMNLDGSMDDMGMEMALQEMDMNVVMYPESNKGTLNYTKLKSPVSTRLPDVPTRTLEFELTGNMNRYVWTVNNKTISEADKILINQGENIRIVVKNSSMMRHPMHLHGHYFRVVNGQGDFAPLKNVLDIMPMETDTIEFHASEEYGDWFFHCHILYHMMSGMGRIFTYANSPPNPQLLNIEEALERVYADDRRFYLGAEVSAETNGTDGEVRYMNTRWNLQTEWRIGINDKSGYEWEVHMGRYLDNNQFLLLYAGWDWRYRSEEVQETNWFGQLNTKNARATICLGLQYTLPFFIVADGRVDHAGNVRLQFKREDIPITKYLRAWANFNSDFEFAVGTKYILTKFLSVSGHYDSDMGWGVGLSFTY